MLRDGGSSAATTGGPSPGLDKPSAAAATTGGAKIERVLSPPPRPTLLRWQCVGGYTLPVVVVVVSTRSAAEFALRAFRVAAAGSEARQARPSKDAGPTLAALRKHTRRERAMRTPAFGRCRAPEMRSACKRRGMRWRRSHGGASGARIALSSWDHVSADRVRFERGRIGCGRRSRRRKQLCFVNLA